MSASLYLPLKEGLVDLALSVTSERESAFAESPSPSALRPISTADLRTRVKGVWEAIYSGEDASQGSSAVNRVEVVRSVMELVGRDMVVTPIFNGDVSCPFFYAEVDS